MLVCFGLCDKKNAIFVAHFGSIFKQLVQQTFVAQILTSWGKPILLNKLCRTVVAQNAVGLKRAVLALFQPKNA